MVFGKNSSLLGSSPYLERKGVGSYGIRFRSSEKYGRVAVVPMRDEDDRLWSYQLLNPDGSKRVPKDARSKSLFHKLQNPINGEPFGIAESYVTAATCFELSGIPMICAFSSNNLPNVASIMYRLYPSSSIFLFADTDRHQEVKGSENVGLIYAEKAAKLLNGHGHVIIPDFGNIPPLKDTSDWNDLLRICGQQEAKRQIFSAFQLATTNCSVAVE